MSRDILQDIIDDFQADNVNKFFRAKTRSFAPRRKEIGQYNDNSFRNSLKLGEIDFSNEGQQLVVCTFESLKPLSERSGKKAQYEKGKRVLKELQADAGIFVFYDKNGNFRFSLIYANYLGKKRDWSTFRRFTYFVSPNLTNKTFLQQIGEGDFSSLENIKKVFSVEKVTKDFYKDIANWYFWAVQNSQFPKDAEAEENGRNIAVIRLITRLIFIWFMRERGLVPNNLFNTTNIHDYLKDISPDKSTYYKAILQNLFFATLSAKQNERKFRSETRGHKGYNPDFGNQYVYRYHELFSNPDKIKNYFGEIPFLNGGLFECLDDKQNGVYIDGFTSTKKNQPEVPNFLFFSNEKDADLNTEYGTKNKKYKVRGLLDTLSFYNFTIDENDPNDAEIALDPELLGKVFENLLASFNPETASTARKATGSYYTPREIVDYMVTQSMREYLKTHLKDITSLEAKLDQLFNNEEIENPFTGSESKKTVKLIDNLRIVDPAVGSGAFPMGILNKLVFVLGKLDPKNRLWKEAQTEAVKKNVSDPALKRKLIEQICEQFKNKNFDYGRKLYLIQKCIYGVDIQQIAVEIAKLRFFIALLVDEQIDKDKDNWGIEPLPNLEFKIMQGNSLISEFMGINLDNGEIQGNEGFTFKDDIDDLIGDFQQKKNEYQNEPDSDKKSRLRQEIDDLMIKIFETKLKKQKKDYFQKLKLIEEKAAIIPNVTKREQYIRDEKAKCSRKYSFDIDRFEEQLREFSGKNKTKPFFAWKLYFAEVFQGENQGFDIVIGNPPYGTKLSSNEKNNLDNRFVEKKSQTKNSAIYFIYASEELLCHGGVNSFIVPKSLTYSIGWNNCASTVLKGLQKLIDSGKAFENVKLEQVIFVRTPNRDSDSFKNGLFNGTKVLEIASIHKAMYEDYKVLLCGQRAEEINTINKIMARSDGCFGEHISIERGLNWQSKVSKNPGKVPIYRGAHLDPYFINHATDYIDLNTFAEAEYKYQFRPKILNQLAIAHVQNPYPHFYLQAALDTKQRLVFETISCTFIEDESLDIEFVLGYNNSKLYAWLLYKLIYSNAIRSTRYDEQYVSRLPWPPVTNGQQKDVVELVNSILKVTECSDYGTNKNKQMQVSQYMATIDSIFYELFNLLPEEIAIVEGISRGG